MQLLSNTRKLIKEDQWYKECIPNLQICWFCTEICQILHRLMLLKLNCVNLNLGNKEKAVPQWIQIGQTN